MRKIFLRLRFQNTNTITLKIQINTTKNNKSPYYAVFSEKKESLITSTIPYSYSNIFCTTFFTRNYFPKKKERIGKIFDNKRKEEKKNLLRTRTLKTIRSNFGNKITISIIIRCTHTTTTCLKSNY
jgi:hypothetical protein